MVIRMTDGRRDSDKAGAMGEWLKWLLGIGLAALLGYEATVNTVNSRISVLETKQSGVEQRLDRMESKIDTLLSRH